MNCVRPRGHNTGLDMRTRQYVDLNSENIKPPGVVLIHVDRQTDRHNEANSHFAMAKVLIHCQLKTRGNERIILRRKLHVYL